MSRRSGVDDGQLDELIRGIDPSRDANLDLGRLERVGRSAELASHHPSNRSRSRLAWIALGCAGIVALGASAPAIADGIQQLAQTGEYGPVTSESDGSQWIDSSGTDFDSFAVSLYPQWLELPAQFPKPDFIAIVVDQLGDLEGVTQETSIKLSFEHNARCMWVDEWLTADSAGDVTRTSTAASMLSESTNWPASVSLDGGGYVEHLVEVATSAKEGDRSVLETEQSADCGSIPDGLRR